MGSRRKCNRYSCKLNYRVAIHNFKLCPVSGPGRIFDTGFLDGLVTGMLIPPPPPLLRYAVPQQTGTGTVMLQA